MTPEERYKNFISFNKAETFRQFERETADQIRLLHGQGYSVDQAIELLKLRALQGIMEDLQSR